MAGTETYVRLSSLLLVGPIVDVVGLSLRKALALAKGEKGDPSTEKLLRNFELRLKEAVKTARALAKQFDVDRRGALAAIIESARDALDGIRPRREA